jgi:superfamily II DNA or RNA helicase
MSVPPEVGQMVFVRGRRWCVERVQPGALGGVETLVELTGIDDDSLGERLCVIWQLEIGAKALEQMQLPPVPSRLDEPSDLAALLNSVRWRAVAAGSRRTLQAPFHGGFELEEYQLEPLVRAIEMPRVNLLIADDVGLGKTIEAGLVLVEMALRARVRNCLVVCPSSLQLKWQADMFEKFGLEFRIVNADYLRQLRRSRPGGSRVNPWLSYPRLIVSIDFLKRESMNRRLKEAQAHEGQRVFDMLILDEAHYIAPSGSPFARSESDRTRVMRDLLPLFEHRLFLSATPHNGYWQSFAALLEMLDPQRFNRNIRPAKAQRERVVVRRLKRDIPPGPDGKPRFPARAIESIDLEYTDAERALFDQLAAWRKDIEAAASADGSGESAARFLGKVLKKRLFSSPAAFARTLEGLRGARGISAAIATRRMRATDDDFDSDEEYEQAELEALHASVAIAGIPASSERRVREMKECASRLAGAGDTKFKGMLEWLKGVVKRADGKWSDQRVLIFTEYRDTQKWLMNMLPTHGLEGAGRIEALYGGMQEKERERVKLHFQRAPHETPVRILIATDCASEGIDLQAHCKHVLHYDIPWNPNRMEQRNGRIDRRGQRSLVVHIRHFASRADATASASLEHDLEYLAKVVRKIEDAREYLGAVNALLAEDIEAAMLQGERRNTSLAGSTVGEIQTDLGTTQVTAVSAQVSVLRQRLAEARADLQLTPANLRTAVELALSLARQQPLQPATIPNAPAASVFRMPMLTGSWAQCREGLIDPLTKDSDGPIERPCTFDPAIAQGRTDVVYIHLEHPLVRLSGELLRKELTNLASHKIARVAAYAVPDRLLASPAAVVHARMNVAGGASAILHEEIFLAGGLRKTGKWERLSQTEIEALLATAVPIPSAKAPTAMLVKFYGDSIGPLGTAIETRRDERAKSIERELIQRRDAELRESAEIFDALQRELEAKLREQNQGDMLIAGVSEEADLIARNKQEINARISRIPAEAASAKALITARYAQLTPRAFPLAVTLLVPESGVVRA